MSADIPFPEGAGVSLEAQLGLVEKAKLRYLDGVGDLRTSAMGLLVRHGNPGKTVIINRVGGMRNKETRARTVDDATAILLKRTVDDPTHFGRKKYNQRVALWTDREANSGTLEGLMTVAHYPQPKGNGTYHYRYFRIPALNTDFFHNSQSVTGIQPPERSRGLGGPFVSLNAGGTLGIVLNNKRGGESIVDTEVRSLEVVQASTTRYIDELSDEIEHLVDLFDTDFMHHEEQGWQKQVI